MCSLAGGLLTYPIVNQLILVVQTHSLELFSGQLSVSSISAILGVSSVTSVSLNELGQIKYLSIVDNLVSSRHGDSTVVVTYTSIRNNDTIVTYRLIEVVGTDYVIVFHIVAIEHKLGLFAVNHLQRSIISQSDNLNLSRNNYTVVRSNDGVTLCHLSSNEGEREARSLIVICWVITEDIAISSHTNTITLCIGNCALARSPSLEHRQQRATVNIERNGQNTILSRDAVLARSCSDSTCSTCVNLSVILEE